MSNRFLFSSLLIVLSVFQSFARQLSADEALLRLSNGRSKVAARHASTRNMRLVYTAQNEESNLFYVFRNLSDDKAVILGADDLLPAVMAYDINHFDADNMPVQLREWLDYYKAVSAQVIKSQVSLKQTQAEGKAVQPLIKTKWDQRGPYNKLCVEMLQRDVPTGCVATAMAQIMNYWKYPTNGIGSHAYTSFTGQVLSADFANTTYDWANMQNFYGVHAVEGQADVESSYTDAQADAVALLMYHCGVAVEMGYSEEGSGTPTSYAGHALVKYFGYDKAMKRHTRDFYTDEEWQQIIIDELNLNRPISYCGHTVNNEGHSFICDGYDGYGYFHFNWGWSGYADGYYMVTGSDPLHPRYRGEGGSLNMDPFIQMQAIITGIQPALNEDSQIQISMIANNSVASSQGNVCAILTTDGTTEVTGKVTRGVQYLLSGGFFNAALHPANVELGAILRNVETGEEYPCEGISARSLKCETGYNYYGPIYLDPIPENGTFEVYPAYLPLGENGKPRGGWQKMNMRPGVGVQKVTLGGEIPAITITDLKLSQDENGCYGTTPSLTLTIKALQAVSNMRVSANIYDWKNISTSISGYTVTSKLTLKKGEEATFSNLPLRKGTELEEHTAYCLKITSSGYTYKLGNLANTKFFFYIGDEKTDAITEIPEDRTTANGDFVGYYYNLQGQLISRPTHGIYIHNGKKILVK